MELRRHYETPEAELLVVYFEKGFATSPDYTKDNTEKLIRGGSDDEVDF